ncbi:unnamed protein product, partial [Scytosiphon promiscuus]
GARNAAVAAGFHAVLAMAGQKKKRRRPPGKYGRGRRGALAVASVITLAILLSCCRAVDADNGNINSGRQSGDLLSDNTTAVESKDRADVPRMPEVAPVEVGSGVDAKNDDGQRREKEEEAAILLPASVATPSNVATDETEEDDVVIASGAASPEGPAGPAEDAPASSVDAAVEDSTAAPAQLGEDAAVGGGVLHDSARASTTSPAAAGAIPPFADSTDVDLDDLPESDRVAAAGPAHTDYTAAAAAAVADEGPGPNSLPHDMSAVVVDGDDGVGEGLHVSQPLDVVDEETSEAEAEALATGADTPADQARHGDGQILAAAGENKGQGEGEGKGEEEGGEREEIGQVERMGDPPGEEIEDSIDLVNVPPVENDLGETAGVVETGADGHEDDESVGSISAELSTPAVVAEDVDDGEDDLDDAAVAADPADADVGPGVGPGDGTDAAASAITQSEQQRRQSPQSPPGASTGPETDLPLDAQASATGAVESADPDRASGSVLAAGDGLKEDEASGGDSNTGGVVDVAVTAEPSPPSDVAGPRTPSKTAATAAAAKDDQQSAEPRGGPSLSTDTTTAAVADNSDLLPQQRAGESH